MKDSRSIAQKKTELLHHLAKYYGIVTIACRKSKLGRTSFYDYVNHDLEFAFKVNEIQESYVDYVESRLFDLIQAGDRTAIFFFLKAKAKKKGYS